MLIYLTHLEIKNSLDNRPPVLHLPLLILRRAAILWTLFSIGSAIPVYNLGDDATVPETVNKKNILKNALHNLYSKRKCMYSGNNLRPLKGIKFSLERDII